MAIAQRHDLASGLNDPFAGGYVLERHAAPTKGIHALQVEIDRRLYLDKSLSSPGHGFDRLAGFIDLLATELGEALLASRYATAAE